MQGTLRRVTRACYAEAQFRARQAYYLTPNVLRPSVPISPTYRGYLETLRSGGLVRIPGEFLPVAEHLCQRYLPQLERFARDGGDVSHDHIVRIQSQPEIDRPYVASLSFKDPALEHLYFHRDLLGMLYNYFHRQPYYRNYPVIVNTSYSGRNRPHNQGLYHKDGGIHQISYMLLLNDVTESDTHMEYALGTHRQWQQTTHFTDRGSISQHDVARRYRMEPVTGPKGTLFLFDAGNGFHRAVYKETSTRIMLHLNVSTGSNLKPDRYDSRAGWDRLRGFPPHVSRMMDKIVAGPDRP